MHINNDRTLLQPAQFPHVAHQIAALDQSRQCLQIITDNVN